MTDPLFHVVAASSQQRIVRSIVVPLSAAIGALLLIVVIGISWLIEAENTAETDHVVTAAASLLRHQIAEEEESVAVGVAGVLGNRAFVEPLRAGDRDRLLDLARPIYLALKRDAQLTHFYFGAPDGTTVLRVHAPAAFGDRYDHLLTPMSSRSGREEAGLELGGWGALSLRIAAPYRDGGQIVGFVELGEEFGHITKVIHETLRVDLIVLIDKRLLHRDRWERGRAAFGWPLPWDQLPSVAVDGATMAEMPAALLERLAQAPADGAIAEGSVRADGRVLHLASLPLEDAAGQRLGSLVVVADRTAFIARSHALMAAIALLGLGVAALLAALFRRILGRVERRIVRATARLARANADLERVAYLACHDLEGPLEQVVNSSLQLERDCSALAAPDAQQLRLIIEGARHLEDTVGILEDYLDLDVNARKREPVVLDAVLAAALEKLGPHMLTADRVTLDPLPTVTGRPMLLARAFFCILDFLLRARLPGQALDLSLSAEGQDGAWRIRFAAAPVALADGATEIGGSLHLAIARRVAEMHGGDLAIATIPGGSTTIILGLGDGDAAVVQEGDCCKQVSGWPRRRE